MFKIKYRVVTSHNAGWYHIQKRVWWFPFWRHVYATQDLYRAVSKIEDFKRSGTMVHGEV